MTFSAAVTRRSDRAHLSVVGELDAFTGLDLRRQLRDALAEGSRHFYVDVEELTFIDAGGLGTLVRLLNATQLIDGSMTVTNASRPFHRALGSAGLTGAFRLAS